MAKGVKNGNTKGKYKTEKAYRQGDYGYGKNIENQVKDEQAGEGF
jgi:hypothetical protein